MTPTSSIPLTLLQTRVLGVLVEKQHTVPDSYPLSLNALTSGCNQKTARDPVLEASEGDVIEAIDELKARHLVFEGSGSRVPRFEHNAAKGLGVPGQSVALLALLMLRGPQTAAELRLNTERLHRFADISSVEGFLDELATREPPLVTKLVRAPGARESRWAHLLSGPVGQAAPPAEFAGSAEHGGDSMGSSALQELRVEQARMQGEIDALRTQLRQVAQAAGVELDLP